MANKIRLLRYDVAWWLLELVWDGRSDLSKTHPIVWRVADKICPGGIPDSW